MENHIILGGYAELPIVVGLMSSVSLFALAVKLDDKRLFFMGVALSLPIIFTKNIGPVLAFVPPLLFFSILMTRCNRQWALRCIVLLMAGVACIAIFGLKVELAHFTFSYDPDRHWLDFGGRRLKFNGVLWARILENGVHAYIYNSSFSLVLAVLIFALLNINRFDIDGVVVILAPALILLFLVIFQFSGYGIKFAAPGSDTGNSRFSLYFAGLVSLCLPLLIKLAAPKLPSGRRCSPLD
jgi:hypothetical protein